MEIKKTSLSRIICDNSDGTVVTIQPNAFRTPKGYCTFENIIYILYIIYTCTRSWNKPVGCNKIPGINFASLLGM